MASSGIICSFSMFETVRVKYPKRFIYPERNIPNGQFCYFSVKGALRIVYPDGSIWICDWTNPPYGRKIWPRKLKTPTCN